MDGTVVSVCRSPVRRVLRRYGAAWLGISAWGWAILILAAAPAAPQDLDVVERVTTSGRVHWVVPGAITLINVDGAAETFQIQDRSVEALPLDNGRIAAVVPTTIRVHGQLAIGRLDRGLIVAVELAQPFDSGQTNRAVRVRLVDPPEEPMGVYDGQAGPDGAAAPRGQRVVGRIESVANGRLVLDLGGSDANRRPRRARIDLAGVETFELASDNLAAVQPGDIVHSLDAVILRSGDRVAVSVDIELALDRHQPLVSLAARREMNFAHLSDEPMPPRLVRSEHFALQTDLSERRAQILASQLELLLAALANYYHSPPPREIRMVVVDDLANWDTTEFPPEALASIRRGGGITLAEIGATTRQATAYTAAKTSIVQHEAVHAFFFLVFGSVQPYWYAEGMAEVGQYWSEGNRAVSLPPVVADYLARSEPPTLAELLGDRPLGNERWQDFAWRWSLCHFLTNHPSYADEFQRVGSQLVGETAAVGLEDVFGAAAPRIAFEYSQFVDALANGYRVDLCAWPWNVNARPLADGRSVNVDVQSGRGWQATGVALREGQVLSLSTSGEWSLGPSEPPTGANGDRSGRGRLIGMLFDETSLSVSEPFDIGDARELVAPSSGHLLVRCADAFHQLADNAGTITLSISLTR